MTDIANEAQEIEACPDLLERALRLAGLVTRLFREEGWELVVVGGSAIEFYTEGAYMSGDVDLCRTDLRPIPPRLAQGVMAKIGATGGPRSWKACGLFVDLLGLLENEARTPLRKIQTPSGDIFLIPLELAVVERTLISVYPQYNPEASEVAKKIMAVCIKNPQETDWAEIRRLASLPAFDVTNEIESLRKEVANGE